MFSFRLNKAKEIKIEERYVITQLDANYNYCIISVPYLLHCIVLLYCID